MHTFPWLTGDFLVFKKSHCLFLTGSKCGCSFRHHLLTHRKATSGGENSKEQHEGRCWTQGGECLSVCTFLHPWVSVYLCVQLWLEREKTGGWSVPGERYGLCPTAFGTKALLLLCMLAVSVGDMVWSWEIRSAPGNETHAKGLHGKLNLSSQVSFISKHFIPSIIFIHYQALLLF